MASEIEKEYLSSLSDLNVNSKPLINMLTILAEENIVHGQIIVDVIEKHITKVSPEAKLPVLYLIDSIVKNVGGEYLNLFSHSVVNIFCGVFKEVNEKVRQKMFSLRQTWNDVFPVAKLYALDVKTNNIDPGWPITAKPAIHVNPNFFKNKTQVPETDVQTQLRDKQRELLELQKRKLELELAATMKHIAEQEKQLQVKTANVAPVITPVVQPVNQTNPPSSAAESSNFPQYQSIDMIQPKIDSIGHKQRTEPVVNPVGNASSARIRDPRIARQMQFQNNQRNFNQRNRAPPPAASGGQRFGPTSSSFVPNHPTDNSVTIRQTSSGFESSHVDDSIRQSRTSSKNRNVSKDLKNRSTSRPLPKSTSKPNNQTKSVSTKSPSKSSSKTSKVSSKTTSPTNRSTSKDLRKDRYKEKESNKISPSRGSAITTAAPIETEKKKKEYTIPFKKRSPSPTKDKAVKSITDPKVSSTTKTPNSSPTKFKGSKANSKSRSYVRRNRDESSPVSCKDSGEIVQTTPPSPPSTTTRSDSIVSPVPPLIEPIANLSAAVSSFKNNVIDTPSKDVDLRVMLSNTGSSPISTTSFGSSISVTPTSIEARKRSSEERTLEEPVLKKRKAEKIDVLFGKEDVDLRTQISQAITPIYPTAQQQAILSSSDEKPDWATIKADSPKKDKSNLDAVRAKLAEASRHFPNKSHRSKDIDLRRRHMREYIEDSQDGNDATFKMILAQAQAQLDNDNMNLEQYNNLMQQVAQAHTKSKKESLKRKNDSVSRVKADNNEDFSSSSCDSNHHPSSSNRHGKRDRRSDSNGQDRDGINSGGEYRNKRSHRDKRNRNSKWAPGSSRGPNSTHKFGGFVQQQQQENRQPIASSQFNVNPALQNPWQNNPQIFPSNVPVGPPVGIMDHNQYIAPPQNSPPTLPSDTNERTINIDSIPREIRFYDEVAIAFMKENAGEPKEIGFQAGERRVVVDGKDSIVLAFNDSYKPFTIAGTTYQIRFGSPIRELYINNMWYECFFGDPPVYITLDGQSRVFQIDGPSPQVRIGNLRTDLVLGKIDLYIDVNAKVSLYLDAQVQQFELNNQTHTVQFADYFLTVLIDKEAFGVEYGGMPKKIRFGGRDHYIRFSVMPAGVVPGMVYIKNMLRTDRHRGMQSPPPITYADIPPPLMIPPANNMLTTTAAAAAATSIQVLPPSQTTVVPVIAPTVAPSINIDDLFQKLLASGILNNATNSESKDKSKEKPKPISLAKPESLKQRQQTHIHVLFSGMQCSSCGVRFPPEQTIKYSQHLDWHFRQNRRDRDSARRAHSRRWYYDVADWIQYEEIEDLDEREKNWFETQQSEMDMANDDSAQRNESPVPSCIAGPDDVDKTCDMCHDQFETFYNEDNEEWHLRNALRVDEKTYHPICFEDYKSSLTLDDSDIKGDLDDENAVELSMKKEPDEVAVEGILLDDDDDVIVLPQEEPLITEIPDDDDAPTSTVSSSDIVEHIDSTPIGASTSGIVTSSTNEENAKYESIGNESDLQILVPQISVVDVEDFEEKPIDSTTDVDESMQTSVKIKEEPKDDGYDDDDGFEDIGTFEEATIIEDNSVDGYVPMPVNATQPQQTNTSTHQTQASMITSLDGNVQLQDAPITIATNKIKINITKNVTKNVINSSENIDKQTESSEKGINAILPEQNKEEEIVFEYKATMKEANFKKLPTVKNGQETSGLCTIM